MADHHVPANDETFRAVAMMQHYLGLIMLQEQLTLLHIVQQCQLETIRAAHEQKLMALQQEQADFVLKGLCDADHPA